MTNSLSILSSKRAVKGHALVLAVALSLLAPIAGAQEASCITPGNHFRPNDGNIHFGGPNAMANEATGGNATAGGINARATAFSATAIGDSALASGDGSSAYGSSAQATGCLSTATGDLSVASGSHSTATGFHAQASGAASTATGGTAKASGLLSTATGTGANAAGDYSSASGVYSTASGTMSTANGGYATASGAYSTATGASAQASATNATADGANARATATNATAQGASAQANHTNSVALGANTRTNEANQVAVGNRRISQVSDGRIQRGSMDAVNGGQIWALQDDWNTRWTNINNRINNRLDGFDKRISGVCAMGQASSQAAISVASINKRNRLGMGAGYCGGEVAVSFGYQRDYTTKGGSPAAFSFGGSTTGDDTSVGVGLGIGW